MTRLPSIPLISLPALTLPTPAPCVVPDELAVLQAYCDSVESSCCIQQKSLQRLNLKWDYLPPNYRKGLFPRPSKCVPVTRSAKFKPRDLTRTHIRATKLPPIDSRKVSVASKASYKSPRASPRHQSPRASRAKVLSAFSADFSKKAVVGVVLQSADNERDEKAAKKRSVKLPFGKDDYMRLKSCFEAIDKDASGTLDWEEMQELGELSSHTITEETFLKMDADGSGSVDFVEMLKCMYPQCSNRALLYATSKWGMPISVDLSDAEEPEWKDMFTREQAQDICDIFASFKPEDSDADHLCFADLRAHLSQSISNRWIDNTLKEFGDGKRITIEQVCL